MVGFCLDFSPQIFIIWDESYTEGLEMIVREVWAEELGCFSFLREREAWLLFHLEGL